MRTTQGTPMRTLRLMPGDKFLRGGSETVYHVFGRFVDHGINLRLEARTRPQDHLHPTVRSSHAKVTEYLEITTTPDRVLTGLLFVDMNTGLAYVNVGDKEPVEGFQLGDTIILITQL